MKNVRSMLVKKTDLAKKKTIYQLIKKYLFDISEENLNFSKFKQERY